MAAPGSTSHPFDAWLALAFDSADALQASAAIAQHRQQREDEGLFTRSYEVVVPANPPPLDAFLRTLAGRMVSFMRDLGVDVRGSRGFFLSVFVGQRLYFIGSQETLALHHELNPPLALPGRVDGTGHDGGPLPH